MTVPVRSPQLFVISSIPGVFVVPMVYAVAEHCRWKPHRPAQTWRDRLGRSDERWRALMPELIEAYLHWRAVNPIDTPVLPVVVPAVPGMNQPSMTGEQVPLPTGPRDPPADHTLTTLLNFPYSVSYDNLSIGQPIYGLVFCGV